MRQVRLYGDLGKRFGKIHNLDVKTPAEAIRALGVLFDGFNNYLFESEKFGIGFKVFNSSISCDEHRLCVQTSGSIKIVPSIFGGNGETKILAGAILVGIGIVVGFTPAAAASPYIINAGVALMIGGAIQLLAGTPPTPDIAENPDSKPSYLFSGAVNTQAQGHPVPLGYGRHIVGSAVISASISTEIILGGS